MTTNDCLVGCLAESLLLVCCCLQFLEGLLTEGYGGLKGAFLSAKSYLRVCPAHDQPGLHLCRPQPSFFVAEPPVLHACA
jgi:hypothetical protein